MLASWPQSLAGVETRVASSHVLHHEDGPSREESHVDGGEEGGGEGGGREEPGD